MFYPVTQKTYHLYIIPLLEIFITNVTPIINKTDTEQSTANINLKIPLISSNNLTILASEIGSIKLDVKEYIMLNIESLIIGKIHIPIIIITPTIPTAFFRITPHPKIASTPSPKIFPHYRN